MRKLSASICLYLILFGACRSDLWGQRILAPILQAAPAGGGGGGATITLIGQQSAQNITGPTITVTPTVGPTAGNLLVVAVGLINSPDVTIGTVKCNDGSATAFTSLSGATSTGTASHGNTSIWYILSAPTGCTIVTATTTGTTNVSNLEIFYSEVHRSTGSWATDGGNQNSSGTGSGTTLTGPAVTTTGSTGFCMASVGVAHTVTTAPATGNEFNAGGVIWSTTTDAAVTLISASAATHTPTFTDNTSADTFSGSTGCFK